MTYAVAAEHGSCDMIYVAGFTTVGSKYEGIETAPFAPDVQRGHIGKQVINPVSVGWVLLGVPLFRRWILPVKSSLNLALIVNTVKADHTLKENVKLRVARRVFRDLVERPKNVDDDLFISVHLPIGFVHAEESRNLYKPSHIVRDQFVINDPSSKLIPLVNRSAIDRDSPFNKLIFARFQIGDDFLCDLSEIASFDIIVSF